MLNAGHPSITRLTCLLLIALLFASSAATADECFYVILNRLEITYTDEAGNVIGESTRYFFGWLCFRDGGGMYEVPVGGDGDGGGDPPATGNPPSTGNPPTGGCSVTICQENCDAAYVQTVAGEMVNTEAGGPTWYQCGPICMDLATSDRNACYAFCLEDCN